MEFFKFEDRETDFPFYKDNPKMSLFKALALVLSIVIGMIFYYLNIPYICSFLFAFVMLVPLLYFLNWDFRALFRKPRLKDLGLAILVVFVYFAYAIVAGYLFESVGMPGFSSNKPVNVPDIFINASYQFINLLFSMMGEELIKIILFLIFLTLIFKFSDKRKLSIILSMFFTLVIFGLLHAPSSSVIVAVVIQGFGSVFHLLLYVKTKNIFVSYLSHFLTDFSALLLSALIFS